MIRWLMFILGWFFSPPAWYRARNHLDDLVTQMHLLAADLEHMAAERKHMEAEWKQMAAKCEQMAAERMQEREQLGEMVLHNLRRAMASVRARSTLSASELAVWRINSLLNALKCMAAPVLHDLTTLKDLQELGQEIKWDPSSEASQAESFIAQMKQHLKLPPGVDIISANKALAANGMEALVQSAYDLDLKVKGKNDALFVPTLAIAMADKYAFIGVKIKQILTYEHLEQEQAEFVAWSLHSYSAYIQVLSDLRTGGVAYWCDPKRVLPDKQLMRMQIFAGMPKLYAFLDSALAAVPESMLGYHTDGRRDEENATCLREELEQPRRCKLVDPALERPEVRQEILRTFFAKMNIDDDAANPDVALADWYPDGGHRASRVPG
ncbi:hypothetical protein COCOBI_07-6750 [Coccomyxa sp. Obi]|nr:hypothetical protein COCOBI_07-6750 [Coccomyxa sp. Obi]